MHNSPLGEGLDPHRIQNAQQDYPCPEYDNWFRYPQVTFKVEHDGSMPNDLVEGNSLLSRLVHKHIVS